MDGFDKMALLEIAHNHPDKTLLLSSSDEQHALRQLESTMPTRSVLDSMAELLTITIKECDVLYTPNIFNEQSMLPAYILGNGIEFFTGSVLKRNRKPLHPT